MSELTQEEMDLAEEELMLRQRQHLKATTKEQASRIKELEEALGWIVGKGDEEGGDWCSKYAQQALNDNKENR